MTAEVRSLKALPRRECLDLLQTVPVGRVSFSVAALPTIVPVTFAVQDDAVVMRTSADTRLAATADGAVLAFEADDFDAAARTGWSVVVTGIAQVVTRLEDQANIWLDVEPFAPGHQEVCVRLPMTVVTGRRIAVEVPQAAAVH